MAADLEKRVAELERRVSSLEDAMLGKKSGDIKGVERLLVEKIDEIGTQDLVLIALSQKPKLTKAQIKQALSDWGKAYGNWFEGGNFSGRLVKGSLLKKDGQDENGEDLFSLTKKGEMQASNLICKIQS